MFSVNPLLRMHATPTEDLRKGVRQTDIMHSHLQRLIRVIKGYGGFSRLLLLSILACSLVAAFFVTYMVMLHIVGPPRCLDFYICLYPYSWNNMSSLNITDFYRQVDIAKEIGAVGIKLHNIECFYDEGLLDDALTYIISNQSMKAILFFQYFNRSHSFPFARDAWDRSGFPYSDDEIDLFIEYLEDVTKIAKDYSNLSYSLMYPFNSNETEVWLDKIETTEYQQRCQDMVTALGKWDDKPIYMVVDLWEKNPIRIYDKLPLQLEGIDGYGWNGYTTEKDELNETLLSDFKEYFDQFCGRRQFISEFGFRTKGNYTHGYASNETRKCELIQEYLDLVYDWNIPIAYFGLTDFPP